MEKDLFLSLLFYGQQLSAIILSIVWPFAQGALNSFGIWLANSKDTAPVLAPFVYGCFRTFIITIWITSYAYNSS